MRVDYAVNEGGGERVELGGRAFYICASAEKMSAPFRLRVHGRSGHASMPGIADNALVKAAPLIEALAAYRPEAEIGPEVAGFLDVVLGEQPRARAGAGPARGARPARARADRAAALADALADDDRRLRAAERRPRGLRRDRRLPHPARADARPTSSRSSARRSGLGVTRPTTSSSGSSAGAGRAPRWTRRSGAAIESWVGGDRGGRAARARLRAPASPTRTGCAMRSARSRTASSR